MKLDRRRQAGRHAGGRRRFDLRLLRPRSRLTTVASAI